MILYNASLNNGLRNFTRFLTNTNDTTYPDADLDASLNSYYELFCTEILEAMDDWDFGAEVATANLVADQQEYVFPSDILQIKRMEITYDGSTWQLAENMDINERVDKTDSATIANDFSSTKPFYDLMDDSIMLYPIPKANVTAGIKIWYSKLPSHLEEVTDEPNFAKPFHKGLAYGASKDYFEKHLDYKGNDKKAQTAEMNLEKYIARMKIHYRKRNQDRKYIIDSYYSDYGYNN